MSCLINGRATGRIGADDRGLQFGDGLFETMAVTRGRIQFIDYHLERLASGCRRLDIPPIPPEVLRRETEQLAREQARAIIKLIVTRGAGGRGYRPPADVTPSRILYRLPWPDHPAENATSGVVVRVCETRLGRNPRLAGLKHLNRLEQVLARNEWDDPAIAEGLMLDEAGKVIEGTMSNVFVVISGRLLTPRLTDCGVAGVMRRAVMELAAAAGIATEERELELEALGMAEEIFLTNSLIGLWPVRGLGERTWQQGAVTRELAARLAAARAVA